MFKLKQLTFAILFSIFTGAYAQRPLGEIIEQGLSLSRTQSVIMAKSLEEQEGRFPRSYEKGKMITSDYRWWCSGFFPGVLWLLYGDNGDNQLRQYAELFTDRCEPVKKMTDTHDLGFMLYCSFGQGYNLTGNPRYLDVIKEGTQSLLTRYDEKLGVIKSWESGPKWKYPVIIDNMMNLEMLCFMTRETNDRHYVHVAEKHANTTMANHFREDFSTYHLVSYDPTTGKPHVKQTVQGFADYSAWARGQAWGLYGYTMMYRETLNPKYLNPAQVRCALTAVIKRQLSQKNTFDANGWLRVGYTGAQIHMSEDYINTGSEYLVCSGFCALGLPATDPFWSNPYADWTSKKAWSNVEVSADHSIRN